MNVPKLNLPAVSLRALVIFIVAMAAIPTLIFCGVLLQRYADSVRARASDELAVSAKGVARAVDAQFVAARAVLLALASSPRLAGGDLPAFERQLKAVTARTGRHFELIEPTGQIVLSTRLPSGAEPPIVDARPWMSVVEDRLMHVTRVLHETDGSDGLVARVIVPILRQEKVAWTLHAIILPQDFAPILSEPGVPQNWIVSVVDQGGTHFIRSHSHETFAGKPLVPKLVDLIKQHGTGTVPTVTWEGISVISAVAYAPRSNWAVAIGLPEHELQAPLFKQMRNLAFLGVPLIVTALVLGFFTARYLVRSIHALSAAAQRVGGGEIVEPPPTSVREVQELAGILSQTSYELRDRSQRLAQLNATLEEQVAARTAQLSETNTRLLTEIRLREDSEAQLRHMQKLEAIGQLTGGIAHDFNNMLAVVISGLQLVRRRLKRGETDVEHLIDTALQSVDRAATLTKRLLAFARQQPLSPESINVNRLLADMEEILRRTLPESIRIETVLAGGLWRTHADTHALESAIINLAVNARDAMAAGGKLTIETKNFAFKSATDAPHPELSPGEYVVISVTDTGQGMSPHVLSRAFDPFFTTKPIGDGTGLGLSQVFGFIKQSGGHTTIDSEVEVGTTVKLYLPRFRVEADPSLTKPRAALPDPTPGARELVLVVEDDDKVRELTVELLGELNYATLQANGGRSALQILDSHPDIMVLLTDIVMPDMNGRTLADEVQRRRPDIRVLFTTGYTSGGIVHEGILDPNVHLLPKPFDLDSLASKLNQVMSEAQPIGSDA